MFWRRVLLAALKARSGCDFVAWGCLGRNNWLRKHIYKVVRIMQNRSFPTSKCSRHHTLLLTARIVNDSGNGGNGGNQLYNFEVSVFWIRFALFQGQRLSACDGLQKEMSKFFGMES
ncbi:hypothetical protein L873DRAFT_680337 [Choiromyces venosus 120613-1]|uniref:Secreted protein n=1 Tax=Choiromyces venosus 120613-1 TaxID=1336337 RepID=A0A3N4IWI6_9PEZI|nr:hypothetical protein L873DRAFT_680337 [Choiromyces venosus 120613-1]